jgi:hypothetical protein
VLPRRAQNTTYPQYRGAAKTLSFTAVAVAAHIYLEKPNQTVDVGKLTANINFINLRSAQRTIVDESRWMGGELEGRADGERTSIRTSWKHGGSSAQNQVDAAARLVGVADKMVWRGVGISGTPPCTVEIPGCPSEGATQARASGPEIAEGELGSRA